MLGGQRGQQRVRGVVGVWRSGQEYGGVPVPEPVGADPVAGTGRGRLRHPDQVQVRQQVVQVSRGEGGEPLRRIGTRAQWRRPVQDRLLQLAFPVIQEGDGKPGLVAEPAEDRPLAHPGGGRHLVHRHRVHAVFAEQPGGGRQHGRAVAGRVRPFPRRRCPQQLQGRCGSGLRSGNVESHNRTIVRNLGRLPHDRTHLP